MNDLFDIFGSALIASFSSAICYLVARRDFPPHDAVIVVIGVLIVGPVLAQIVSAWVGVSAGWLGLFFGFGLIGPSIRSPARHWTGNSYASLGLVVS